MSSLIPSATVDSIVAKRNATLAAYERAHEALAGASDALRKAAAQMHEVSPGETSLNFHIERESRDFIASLEVPERDGFLDTARRLVDANCWAHIIRITDLDRLMDKKAKDEFRQQLIKDPPEPTVDTIRATLQQFMADAETIFARGVAECFSNLDRRFRSHDGWKIGSRVILTRAFTEDGHWNYYCNKRDTIQDIERAFLVLDGREVPPGYGGLVGAIEEARRGAWGARQTCVESEFFTARIYKNGNAHLWFKRDDLLRKVNRLLADYYGEVIPEEREPDEDDGLHEVKTTPAKRFGFYPTPEPAVAHVMEMVPLWRRDGDPPLTVLEPSAGTGNLAAPCVERGAVVDCIEIQPRLADELRASRRYHSVYCADFLALQPDPNRLYDRIVMNPPFDRERDIDHVLHALKFLKEGGCLVAVMSAGTEFRETRKSRAFRRLMEEMRADWRDLPARSFAEVGTNCNTLIVRVWKRGRAA